MTADISFIDFDEIENTGNGCIPILLQSTKPSFLKEEALESSSSLTNPLNLPSLTSTATTVVGSIENSSLLRRSVRPNKPSSESLLLSSPIMNYPRFNEKKKKNGKKNEQDREEEGEERKRKKSKISELNTPIKSSASASASVISNMETSPSPVLSPSTSILKFKLPLKDKDGSHSSVPSQHPIDPACSILLDKKKKINLRGLKLMMPEDVKYTATTTQEVIENISLPKSDNLESESEFEEEVNIINTSGNPRSKTLSGGAKASTPLKTNTKTKKKKENITNNNNNNNNNNNIAKTTIDHRSFHNHNFIAPSTPDHFEIVSKKPIRSSTSISTATSLNFSTIPKSSMLTATNAIDLNETVHVHDSISSKTSSSSTNKNNIKYSIKSIKLRNFSAAPPPTSTSTSTVSSLITSVVSPATLPTVTVPILTPSSTSTSSSSRPSRLPSLPAKPEKKNLAKRTEIVNEDICSSCGGLGNFICCDSCPRSFHFTCAEPPLDPQNVPESDWFCSECTFASKNNKKDQEQTSKHKNSTIEPTAPLNQMWEKIITSVTQMNPKCFVMPRRFRYQPKDEDLLKLKNHEFYSSKDKDKEKEKNNNNNNIINNNYNNNNNANENSANGRRSIIIDSSKSSSADTMLTVKSDTQPPCPPIVITHTDNTANTIITVNGLQAPNISRFKKPTGYCHCCGLFGVTKSAVNTGTISTTTTTSTQEEIFELPIESSLNRPLVSCSICPLYWHLDCHDPPLVNYPSQSTSWTCPIHFTAERCIALDLFEPLVQSTYLLPESAIKLQFSQKRARIDKEREEAECLRFSPQTQNDPDIETDRDFIYVPEIIKSSYPYQPYQPYI